VENGRIKKNITTLVTSKPVCPFIGFKLLLPKLDWYDRRIKAGLKLLVAPIYYPVDDKDHKEFNDELNDILQTTSKSAEFLVDTTST